MEEDNNERPQNPAPRRPYQAPKIEETANFENLVLACLRATTADCGKGNAKS
jgi:hypothetical protein